MGRRWTHTVRASEFVTEHRMVWRRNPRTGKVRLAWRCESGPRKGRTVPDARQCSKGPDVGRAHKMKVTRARTALRQARKAKKTKRINPQHKLLRLLNR